MAATAMVDRLIHHAEILSLKGDSYRLKDRDLGPRPGRQSAEISDATAWRWRSVSDPIDLPSGNGNLARNAACGPHPNRVDSPIAGRLACSQSLTGRPG